MNTSLFYAKFACLISFWSIPLIHRTANTHIWYNVCRQPWFQFIILNYICIVCWQVFVLAFAKNPHSEVWNENKKSELNQDYTLIFVCMSPFATVDVLESFNWKFKLWCVILSHLNLFHEFDVVFSLGAHVERHVFCI